MSHLLDISHPPTLHAQTVVESFPWTLPNKEVLGGNNAVSGGRPLWRSGILAGLAEFLVIAITLLGIMVSAELVPLFLKAPVADGGLGLDVDTISVY